MKVVFDTNIYVAEALGGETASGIIASTVSNSWRIYVSDYILTELHDVMLELGLSRRSATLAGIRLLRRASVVASAVSRHKVLRDPADNAVLATARAAGADFLVSNDRHLLELGASLYAIPRST